LTVVHKYPIQAFDGTVTLLELMNMLSVLLKRRKMNQKEQKEPYRVVTNSHT